MITKNDDYGYIQQFIEYLRQIIEMLMKLFKGSDDEAADDNAAADGEANA